MVSGCEKYGRVEDVRVGVHRDLSLERCVGLVSVANGFGIIITLSDVFSLRTFLYLTFFATLVFVSKALFSVLYSLYIPCFLRLFLLEDYPYLSVFEIIAHIAPYPLDLLGCPPRHRNTLHEI